MHPLDAFATARSLTTSQARKLCTATAARLIENRPTRASTPPIQIVTLEDGRQMVLLERRFQEALKRKGDILGSAWTASDRHQPLSAITPLAGPSAN